MRTGCTKFAAALATEAHEPVRVALRRRELLVDQAEVIIAAIDALPDDIDPAIVVDAQATLLGYAADHDAKALRILGKRILEVVAPEVGEAHEAKVLEKEERDAAATARLWGRRDGHGKVRFGGELPEVHWDMLHKAVLAHAAPKHRAAVDGYVPNHARPTDHKLGLAFMEYIETYPADLLPKAGGVSATVVVTMTLETLMGGLKAAQLDTGHRISPGLARKLACRAGIIPAVLGGKSTRMSIMKAEAGTLNLNISTDEVTNTASGGFYEDVETIQQAKITGGRFVYDGDAPPTFREGELVDVTVEIEGGPTLEGTVPGRAA